MEHKTEYVTEGNDRFYQCSCGKQVSTGHEADKHLLRAENERLREAMQMIVDRGIKCEACGHVERASEHPKLRAGDANWPGW